MTGVIAALPTPFRTIEGQVDRQGNLQVDLEVFADLVARQIVGGAGCVAVATVTGEAPTLSPTERSALIRTAVEVSRGAAPVLAGIVRSATASCIEEAAEAEWAGADALLVATPPYNKPTAEGVVRHVTAIAEATRLPIVLHDDPGRTGIRLPAEVVRRLADRGTIVGFVDGAGDPANISTLVQATASTFRVFGASDATALDAALAGGHGFLSVAANLAPRLCAALHKAAQRGDWASAIGMQRRLRVLAAALALEPDPASVKLGLSDRVRGLTPRVRLPMIEASSETGVAIAEALRDIGTEAAPAPSVPPAVWAPRLSCAA